MLTEFHKHKKYTYQYNCIECGRKYYQTNKNIISTNNKNRYEYNSYRKKYCGYNKVKQKEYYKKNKNTIKEREIAYRKTPKGIAVQISKDHRRRSRKGNGDVTT